MAQPGPVAADGRRSGERLVDQRFLRGPVPISWLMLAAKLPRKALAVAIALQFLSGIQRSATVYVDDATLLRFGVSRFEGRRAVRLLEQAGLVKIVKPGSRPMIMIRTPTL